MDMIERVQRRATKMIEGLSKLGYDERLRKTGLISLEKKKLGRRFQFKVFRMFKGFDKINYRDYFGEFT